MNNTNTQTRRNLRGQIWTAADGRTMTGTQLSQLVFDRGESTYIEDARDSIRQLPIGASVMLEGNAAGLLDQGIWTRTR